MGRTSLLDVSVLTKKVSKQFEKLKGICSFNEEQIRKAEDGRGLFWDFIAFLQICENS